MKSKTSKHKPRGPSGEQTGSVPRLLKVAVFFCGMAVMGVEMAAMRLMAPFYGTSLFVTTNIIGIFMLSLSAGYFFGGRVADRWPRPSVFFSIILASGLLVASIPWLSHPILSASVEAMDRGNAGLVVASLLGTLGLFVVPVTLLGMVSPYAIRLATPETEVLGHVAGSFYSLSTVGSILGTFMPALLTIPLIGTARTFLLFALTIVLVGALGLRHKAGVAAPLAVGLLFLLPPGRIHSDPAIIHESESAYHYIQVKQRGSRRLLILNEGRAVHSILDTKRGPHWPLVGSVWDAMNTLPILREAPIGSRLETLLVGLAAGTIPKQLGHFYGKLYDLHIDGVEIDGDIVQVARDYFELNEPFLDVHVQDGRIFLAQTEKKYDLVISDAYRQPYIPFHLATREYFSIVRDHLTDGGIMAINVGSISEEGAVLNRIIATVQANFRHVKVLKVPNPPAAHFDNYLVVARKGQPLRPQLLDPRSGMARTVATASGNPFLSQILARAARTMGNHTVPEGTLVLEDDRAPVEVLTDLMLFEFATSHDVELIKL